MSDIRDFCCDVCEGTGHHTSVEIDHDGSEGLWFDPSRRCECCNGRGYVFEPVWPIDMEDLPPPTDSNPHRSDASPGAAIARRPPVGNAAPVSYFETNFPPIPAAVPDERGRCGGGPQFDQRSAPRAPGPDP